MPDVQTVGAAIAAATERLKQADVAETPRLDAILLLEQASGIDANRLRLDPAVPLTSAVVAAFGALLQRRLAHEPVSKIVGFREFWSLSFRTGRDVLDPRPDSETLVAGVLAAIADKSAPLRLVDFGTGSGCLLLSLLHELPNATGLGVDLSPAALAIARDNAGRLGLAARAEFREGNWGQGLAGAFDVLMSNPPYIESAVVPTLEPEVAQYDPVLALDGGPDGLDAYRRLAPDLARLAAPAAVVALEVGQGQDAAVSGLLAAAGFSGLSALADLGGIRRVVVGRKAA
ncbi:peptide chain release factor N(5)-glutamine methyltransferase [Ferrovibrio xuzhouensis]|uniref:Release factor glutamine methyltransferase n=1 Tax=Ferrovibrio xuzhouensis TaxID=1576914 RepID=A0ABV7VHZ4_9PROT